VRQTVEEFGFTAHIKARGEEAQAIKKRAGYKARRWVVERTHSWMNRFRGILIRWNKKAANYIAMLHFALAIIASGQGHAYPGLPGHEPDLAAARKESSAVAQAMNELRKVAPDGGAYVSESNYFEKSFGQAYWGTNYAKLEDNK